MARSKALCHHTGAGCLLQAPGYQGDLTAAPCTEPGEATLREAGPLSSLSSTTTRGEDTLKVPLASCHISQTAR